MAENQNGATVDGAATEKKLKESSSHTERREDFKPSVGLTTEG
jgi:hypothetical protein